MAALTYGVIWLDYEVRHPEQALDPDRLQAALKAQQEQAARANVDRAAIAARTRTKADGIKTGEVVGTIPRGRDAFVRALPGAGGTGTLSAVSQFGATVRALEETKDGITRRVLEFDYSTLGFGNGDKVEFLPISNGGAPLNPRQVTRGVYHIDDPGSGAATITAAVTYSGVTRYDVLPLTGNALAGRFAAGAGSPAR